MDRELSAATLESFLARVGERITYPVRINLLGGSGLILLGHHRPTVDIDFEGEEEVRDELREVLATVAAEMQVEIEAVPIGRFIPLPKGASSRSIPFGVIGNLEVFVFDPYSIALSKLDRGFDPDIEDVVFLIRQSYVDIEVLESMLENAILQAKVFDLDPSRMRRHLKLVRKMLTER